MSTLIAALIKKKLVTSEQLHAAKEQRASVNKPIQELLIDMGSLNEEDLFNMARKVFPRPTIDLDQMTVDTDLLALIPFEKAITHNLFPVSREKDVLSLAMSDPTDVIARDEIHFITNLTIRPLLCKRSQIAKYINKYYPSEATVQEILKDTIDDTQIDLMNEERMTDEEIVDLSDFKADNSTVIKLINKIICDALDARASDVHIEPQEKTVEVRYRIDGDLKNIIKIPRDLHPRLAARIKILAKLDIAEQRKVQEGRINIHVAEKKIDLRISVIPVFYGEKIVLRILDTRSERFDLNKIGFDPDQQETFRAAIRKPQGVILVTGPTGSGKTTTLYAALQDIKCETKNIVTIEDPIEYLIDGINQLQLSRFKDLTFASGLRSILRQDPDVILVGEIRDRETAEVAFRAALTGHVVFSTLHTNNSASSVTRLLDIGLESYLISSSLIMLVAQRLVRLICPNCCGEHRPDKKLISRFKRYLDEANVSRFFAGRGCEHCNYTGFHGRTSVFEILTVEEKIRDLIFNKASEHLILKEARENGMRTLVESGVKKVAAGLTTLEEVAKVVDVAEEGEPHGFPWLTSLMSPQSRRTPNPAETHRPHSGARGFNTIL